MGALTFSSNLFLHSYLVTFENIQKIIYTNHHSYVVHKLSCLLDEDCPSPDAQSTATSFLRQRNIEDLFHRSVILHRQFYVNPYRKKFLNKLLLIPTNSKLLIWKEFHRII